MDFSNLTPWFSKNYLLWANIAFAFLVIFCVLIINGFFARAFTSLANREEGRGDIWITAALKSLNPPFSGLIWIIGLTVAVGYLERGEEATLLSQFFPPARDIAVIAVIVWFLLRAVRHVEIALQVRARKKGYEIDPTATDAIGKLVRAAIIITAVLAGMQALGFSISGILAFGGIGGIAIGFAAQGLVANLFGGLTIYASRPFKVGEWIIMPGNEVMGEVQDIGWRATRVMGFDRRPFYVPNALFNTAVVINHSRMTARRIQEYIHVRYRDIDKIPAIIAGANRMLGEHPGIQHDFFVFQMDSYGDFAIKLFLYAFTAGTDYNDYMVIKEDILLKIAGIVHEHGGEIAVPTSTVHVPDGVSLQATTAEVPPEPFLQGIGVHAGRP